MSKKVICLALGVILLALCFPAQAQQPRKVPLIGSLSAGPGASRTPLMEGLRELGYVEGRNFNVVNRGTYGKTERYPEFVTELINLKAAKQIGLTVPRLLLVRADKVIE